MTDKPKWANLESAPPLTPETLWRVYGEDAPEIYAFCMRQCFPRVEPIIAELRDLCAWSGDRTAPEARCFNNPPDERCPVCRIAHELEACTRKAEPDAL